MIPSLNLLIGPTTLRIAGRTPIVERAPTGYRSGHAGTFMPREMLLVKQINPVGRQPIEHRGEIPSYGRLSIDLHDTLGNILTGDDDLDLPHRPAMASRSSPNGFRIREPANSHPEGFGSAKMCPVTRHRCSTPIRYRGRQRGGTAASGYASPAPIGQARPVLTPAHRAKVSGSRARFHQYSKGPRRRSLLQPRSGDRCRHLCCFSTTLGPSSVTTDAAPGLPQSLARQHCASRRDRAFRIRHPGPRPCVSGNPCSADGVMLSDRSLRIQAARGSASIKTGVSIRALQRLESSRPNHKAYKIAALGARLCEPRVYGGSLPDVPKPGSRSLASLGHVYRVPSSAASTHPSANIRELAMRVMGSRSGLRPREAKCSGATRRARLRPPPTFSKSDPGVPGRGPGEPGRNREGHHHLSPRRRGDPLAK